MKVKEVKMKKKIEMGWILIKLIIIIGLVVFALYLANLDFTNDCSKELFTHQEWHKCFGLAKNFA